MVYDSIQWYDNQRVYMKYLVGGLGHVCFPFNGSSHPSWLYNVFQRVWNHQSVWIWVGTANWPSIGSWSLMDGIWGRLNGMSSTSRGQAITSIYMSFPNHLLWKERGPTSIEEYGGRQWGQTGIPNWSLRTPFWVRAFRSTGWVVLLNDPHALASLLHDPLF